MAEDPKIIRLYHYMPAKYAEEFLREDKIKLCDISKSNDLCEFTPKMVEDEKTVEAYMAAIISDNVLATFKASKPPLVLSFSTRISSSAMWGHYADTNTGVCLAFDFPIENLKVQHGVLTGTVKGFHDILFQKVRYAENRFEMPASKFIHQEKMVSEILCSAAAYKALDWEYEKECRIVGFITKDTENIYAENEKFYMRNLRKFLAGVILGPKCDFPDIYIESILYNLKKELKPDEVHDGLINGNGIARACLDNRKLEISAVGFEDFNFDSIQP